MSECNGCTEYNWWSRRGFLYAGGSGLAAMLGAPAWLPKVAYAQSAATRDVLLVVFLRGGCDGLSLVVPHGEDAYYNARPTIAIPRPDSGQNNRAVDLDGFFGFSDAMSGLMPAFTAGDLLAVQATGSMDDSRSHFDAMKFMELGKPRDESLFTGWVARHLLTSDPSDPDPILRAVAMSEALPTSMQGSPQSLPIQDFDRFGVGGESDSREERVATLRMMYDQAGDLLRVSADNTFRTMDQLDAIDFDDYQPADGVTYPESGFGRSLESAAALIKSDIGVEAISVDKGGWDTHDSQNPLDGGMAGNMADLASSLAAFHADMVGGPNYTLVCMSEFGRRVGENGNRGTDHGHGNMMLAMGQNIDGGRVLADWPGLEPGQLFESRDLDVTIDYRDILTEILVNRLNNGDIGTIFPDFTPTPRMVTV
jgi:uncharacterized protein (DUF1501 family)